METINITLRIKPEELFKFQDYVKENYDFISLKIAPDTTKMYEEARFLGGFEYSEGNLRYVDSNTNDIRAFQGIEQIHLNNTLIYELTYHGGLIRD